MRVLTRVCAYAHVLRMLEWLLSFDEFLVLFHCRYLPPQQLATPACTDAVGSSSGVRVNSLFVRVQLL